MDERLFEDSHEEFKEKIKELAEKGFAPEGLCALG